MLFSFVVPEIILGVVAVPARSRTCSQRSSTWAPSRSSIGLITFQLSYPVIIVRARLLTIGPEYEEAAMDLGAAPNQALRRVLLPLLYPAIFASFAMVFADTIDDFVTVRLPRRRRRTTEPLSVKIYSAARASPTPAVNAAATFMLISTFMVIALGWLAVPALHARDSGRADVGSFVQL